MSKHTQGPWKTRECTKCRVWELTGPKNEEILCSHYMGDDIDGDHYGAVSDEANARLIAAAPELLEALKGVHDSLLWHSKQHGNVGMDAQRLLDARAAIAKATGESA